MPSVVNEACLDIGLLANRFNYARDMCHGTTLHPAAVRAVFEPGKSQKADGLTKVLNK